MCERKGIQPGSSLRITEVGDGFYITPVPEPTEDELAMIFKSLDKGRRHRPISSDDEDRIQDEISKYRDETKKRRK